MVIIAIKGNLGTRWVNDIRLKLAFDQEDNGFLDVSRRYISGTLA